MSKKKDVETKKIKEAAISKESEHPLHELREHSRELFGVKQEVFDASFFNFKGVQVTKSEAKNRIKAFLNKEVK